MAIAISYQYRLHRMMITTGGGRGV